MYKLRLNCTKSVIYDLIIEAFADAEWRVIKVYNLCVCDKLFAFGNHKTLNLIFTKTSGLTYECLCSHSTLENT